MSSSNGFETEDGGSAPKPRRRGALAKAGTSVVSMAVGPEVDSDGRVVLRVRNREILGTILIVAACGAAFALVFQATLETETIDVKAGPYRSDRPCIGASGGLTASGVREVPCWPVQYYNGSLAGPAWLSEVDRVNEDGVLFRLYADATPPTFRDESNVRHFLSLSFDSGLSTSSEATVFPPVFFAPPAPGEIAWGVHFAFTVSRATVVFGNPTRLQSVLVETLQVENATSDFVEPDPSEFTQTFVLTGFQRAAPIAVVCPNQDDSQPCAADLASLYSTGSAFAPGRDFNITFDGGLTVPFSDLVCISRGERPANVFFGGSNYLCFTNERQTLLAAATAAIAAVAGVFGVVSVIVNCATCRKSF